MNMQNPLDYARHAALLSDQIDRSELAVILREFERVQDIAGDVVEFGCFAGTTSVHISKWLEGSDRTFHVYDSFAGLPENENWFAPSSKFALLPPSVNLWSPTKTAPNTLNSGTHFSVKSLLRTRSISIVVFSDADAESRFAGSTVFITCADQFDSTFVARLRKFTFTHDNPIKPAYNNDHLAAENNWIHAGSMNGEGAGAV